MSILIFASQQNALRATYVRKMLIGRNERHSAGSINCDSCSFQTRMNRMWPHGMQCVLTVL